MKALTFTRAVGLVLLTASAISVSESTAVVAREIDTGARWDFNGDGAKDLAIGVPDEDGGAGGVHVLYGSTEKRRLTASGSQLLTSASNPSIQSGRAGGALASGDFNGDGFGDLAIGAPYAWVPFLNVPGGAVDVLYGEAGGLTGWKHQVINRLNAGFPTWPAATVEDSLGSALAAGDFNNDGYDDLAIGVPGGADGGYVLVFNGSEDGFRGQDVRLWTQADLGFGGLTHEGRFGGALHAGNFGGSQANDLVMSDPGEPGPRPFGKDFGAAHVVYGSNAGLTAAGSLYLDKAVLGDSPYEYDRFGQYAASGDFNGDGIGDLAIDRYVLKGSRRGLLLSTAIRLPSPTFPDALAAGNFGGTECPACDDLAIGDQTFHPAGTEAPLWSGRVIVYYGAAAGLLWGAVETWSQAGPVPGVPEHSDFFGTALAVHDFGGDGFDDLAIGVEQEKVAGVLWAGAVNVIYGWTHGLTVNARTPAQLWSQATAGIAGTPEQGDFFGSVLGK
jgi:FG-GAP repeat